MRKTISRCSVFMAGLAAVALVPPSTCSATTYYWIWPTGGLFSDPASWSPYGVPVHDNPTIYNLDLDYTIQLDQNAHVKDAQIQYGHITFDLGGQTLEVDHEFVVANEFYHDASVTIQGGILSTLQFEIAENGSNVNNRPRGMVTASGHDTRIEVQGHVEVGVTGYGRLELSNGADFVAPSAPLSVASIPGSEGRLLLTGAGTTMQVSDLIAGEFGSATLLIDDGATFSTTRGVYVSRWWQGETDFIIRGEGSSWTHTREPANSRNVLGGEGSLAFGVLDGGVFQSDELVEVGAGATLFGDGILIGTIESDGSIRPGGYFDDAADEPIFEGMGTFNIQGSLLHRGDLFIELAGALAGEWDVLAVDGQLTLEGNLAVELSDGFVPAYGDAFEIIRCTDLSGSFGSHQLPDLPGSLDWDIEQASNSLTLTVIPLPATLPSALLLLGALTRRR